MGVGTTPSIKPLHCNVIVYDVVSTWTRQINLRLGVYFQTHVSACSSLLTVLCFVFVARTVLITHGCLGYSWAMLQSINAVFSHPRPQRPVVWGWARGWEGIQPGQLTQSDQRDNPCHVMPRLATKAKRGRGREEAEFCLPMQPLQVERPSFPGSGLTSPANG